MTTLYGIKNCDTMKKAMRWLSDNNIDYTFHDYRKEGIDPEWVKEMLTKVEIDVFINKRGTTFRQLDADVKAMLNEQSAIPLLVAQPAMIKRPILIHNDSIQLGFKPEVYSSIFL
ncbi:MAG: ArsC family reductase [Glaciecola sp.]|nr:ArsC family reductase [Glaciecola sp.]MDG1814669.1 ArsC family reductase [Glaciecola sp.]MDG2100265.1 ArsC family reductase [Glaciecola sp.]